MRYRDIMAQTVTLRLDEMVALNLPNAVFQRAARSLLQAIDWGGGEGETVMQELGIDEEEFDRSKRSVKAKLKEWAWEKVMDGFEEIEYEFRNGTLPIYRIITAPPDWQPEPGRHPGVYWSWDEDAAEAHYGEFGDNHVEWLLIAQATPQMIDWENTLRANAQPDVVREREITLKHNIPVKFTYRRVSPN